MEITAVMDVPTKFFRPMHQLDQSHQRIKACHDASHIPTKSLPHVIFGGRTPTLQ
jgi:hypothetical protein